MDTVPTHVPYKTYTIWYFSGISIKIISFQIILRYKEAHNENI